MAPSTSSRIRHPTRYRDEDRTLAALEGARGIEVYTSRHNAGIAAYHRELAESKQKWTSSSDDHQNARATSGRVAARL